MEVLPDEFVLRRRRAARFAERFPSAARFIFDTGPNVTNAKVTRIDAKADTGERTIEADADLPPPTLKITPPTPPTMSAATRQFDVGTNWMTPEGKRALEIQERCAVGRDRPTVGSIIQALADVCGLTAEEIKGPRRARHIAHPRQVAVYLVKNLRPDLSLPKIGHLFGGRDHTTCMHAIRVVEERIAEGGSSKHWYEAALAIVREQFPEQ